MTVFALHVLKIDHPGFAAVLWTFGSVFGFGGYLLALAAWFRAS